MDESQRIGIGAARTAAREDAAADARRTEAQSMDAVLMIRPARFASNPETHASNRFQAPRAAAPEAAAAARAEHDGLAAALARAGIDVHVFEGRASPVCPDEVFPNNWLSCHADGAVVLYPMLAPNRRLERRLELVDALAQRGFAIDRVIDLSGLEQDERFLEGTGSLVLDRAHRIAYAARSPRTHEEAVAIFAERLGYDTVLFDARDMGGHAIYHTNVLMSVGTRFAIVCAEAIDERERSDVLERLASTGKEIVEIGYAELAAFAGNLLELRGAHGPVIALSRRALDSLDARTRRALERHGELVAAPVHTIETLGGGSVRCMLCEVALPRRE